MALTDGLTIGQVGFAATKKIDLTFKKGSEKSIENHRCFRQAE